MNSKKYSTRVCDCHDGVYVVLKGSKLIYLVPNIY